MRLSRTYDTCADCLHRGKKWACRECARLHAASALPLPRPLTPLLARDVRRAVLSRDECLVDLELCPLSRQQTEWAQDRRVEVISQNAFLARSAAQMDMDPAELIAAARVTIDPT